jgi:hypothetical protein
MPWTGPWRRTVPPWGPLTPRPIPFRSRMNISIGVCMGMWPTWPVATSG